MLGGGVVAQHVYLALKDRTVIQAAIGNPPRLKKGSATNMAMPHAIHWPESSQYAGPITTGYGPYEETIRYALAFWCEGESDVPIRAAAKDAWAALSGESAAGVVTQDDGTFTVNLTITGGLYPETHTPPGGLIYTRLGFVMTAFVARA